jgi:hypothetical protein
MKYCQNRLILILKKLGLLTLAYTPCDMYLISRRGLISVSGDKTQCRARDKKFGRGAKAGACQSGSKQTDELSFNCERRLSRSVAAAVSSIKQNPPVDKMRKRKRETCLARIYSRLAVLKALQSVSLQNIVAGAGAGLARTHSLLSARFR